MRRVVTGHMPDGKVIVVSDTEVDVIKFTQLPGAEYHKLWGADKAPTFPDDGSPPQYLTYFPPVGGFRFVIITMPPESAEGLETLDIKAVSEEWEEKMPGAGEYMEEDNLGMHTTDTIDFEYIISGEVWLELDDGKEVLINAGDTVVQNGTRHAWHNQRGQSLVVCLYA